MEPIHERIEDFIRRWRSWHEGNRVFRVLAVAAVLAAVGVYMASLTVTPMYQSSADLLVGWQQAEGSGEEIQTLEYREPPQALGLIHAIDSRPVAAEAARRLELEMTPDELLDGLAVEQVENTQFVQVSYTGPDPVEAAKIANTVGEASSVFVSESSAGDNQLRPMVWEKATVPESPMSPRPLRNGLLTLVVGLVLSAVLTHGLPRSLAAGTAQIADGLVESSKFRAGQALAVVRTRLAGGRRAALREAEALKEKELLLALGRCGKLTAVGAALETSLEVAEADRMLQELAAKGHLEVTVEDGKLRYSFWEHGA